VYRVPPQMTLPVTSAIIIALLLILFFNILNFLSQLFYIIEIKAFPAPSPYGRTVLCFYLQSAKIKIPFAQDKRYLQLNNRIQS
jgi:hypothetical protein